MKKYLFAHWAGAAISIVVGLIYVSHHFFIPHFMDKHSGAYYPITERLYLDEATFYGLRANAAYNGQWIIGDINTREHQGGPALMSLLNPLVMGNLAKVAGSLKNGIIISDFIFPVAIFLLVYAIGVEFTRRRTPSLLFASVFLFAPKFGIYIPPFSSVHIRELVAIVAPFLSSDQPLYFSQFEEPKLTFPFLALAFFLCFRAFKHPSGKRIILGGISFGLLFYTYFYDWMSFSVSMALLVLMLLFFSDKKRALSMASVIGVGALISVYYWINFFYISTLTHAKEITARTGKEISHSLRIAPVWKSYIRNVVLIGLLASYARKRKKNVSDSAIFLGAFLLNYFVTVNLQIITGFNLQPDHWYRTQFLIVAIAVFLLGLWFYDSYLQPYVARAAHRCGMVIIAALLIGNAYGQYLHSRQYAHLYAIPPERMESYAWLNAHTQKYSVIGALRFNTNVELQLHTHNKIFIPNGLNTLASNKEIWSRFFYINNLLGVMPKALDDLLRNGDAAYYLFSETFGDHGFNRAFSGVYRRAFPESMIAEKIKEYENYRLHVLAKSPYRLDYLYTDAQDNSLPIVMNTRTMRIKKIYENKNIRIYQFTD